MEIDLLEEIGLTKSEIKVYYALLELGSTTTGKIVDKAEVASSKIYEILDKLIDKGLASYIIKSGTKYFEAAAPKRIIDYVEQKQEKISRQKNELKRLLPGLELKQKLSKYKSEAKIYKGDKGIETAFYEALDLLTEKDEMLVIGIPSRSKQLNRFFVRFGNERAKRNIWMRAIFNEQARGEEQTKDKNIDLMKIKYIPQITPAAINIFKNRVLIFPETKDEPLLIAIDNEEIAESFRVQFETSWNQRVKTYEGEEQIRNLIRESLKFGDYKVFAEGMKIVDILGEDFFIWWQKEKKKLNIKSKGIMGSDYRNSITTTNSITQFKFIPGYENPGILFIFDDKIASINFSKKPVAFLIENKEVAEANNTYFELLWNQDTSVLKGFEGLKESVEQFMEELETNNEPYRAIGASFGREGKQKEYIEVFNELSKSRLKKKLKSQILYEQGTNEAIIKKELGLKENAEKKFLPYKTKSPVAILPSKEKTLMIIQKEEPTIISINNKDVSESFKEQFEQLWNQDMSTTTGFKEVTKKFDLELSELKEGEEYYVLGASLELGSKKLQNWTSKFHKKRIGGKKRVKFLTTYEAYEPIKQAVKKSGDKNLKLTEIKKLSQEFSTPFQINLWQENKVWFTFWEKDMRCFEIISKDAHNNFKTYFDALWNQETTISKGFDALKTEIYNIFDELGSDEPYRVLNAAFGEKEYNKQYIKFFEEIHKERIKKNIKGEIIFQQGIKKILKQFKKKEYKDNITIKYSKQKTESPVAIFPIKKSTLLVIQKKEPIIIKIENKELTESFKKQFELEWNQEARIERGLDAIQNLFEDMLEAGSCDFIGARGYFLDRRKDYIENNWVPRAEKSGFKMRNITDLRVKGHEITKFSFAKTKYTLEKEFAELSVFWIFGGKVAISNWAGKEPIVTIIENKQMFELYKKQFESLWNKK